MKKQFIFIRILLLSLILFIFYTLLLFLHNNYKHHKKNLILLKNNQIYVTNLVDNALSLADDLKSKILPIKTDEELILRIPLFLNDLKLKGQYKNYEIQVIFDLSLLLTKYGKTKFLDPKILDLLFKSKSFKNSLYIETTPHNLLLISNLPTVRKGLYIIIKIPTAEISNYLKLNSYFTNYSFVKYEEVNSKFNGLSNADIKDIGYVSNNLVFYWKDIYYYIYDKKYGLFVFTKFLRKDYVKFLKTNNFHFISLLCFILVINLVYYLFMKKSNKTLKKDMIDLSEKLSENKILNNHYKEEILHKTKFINHLRTSIKIKESIQKEVLSKLSEELLEVQARCELVYANHKSSVSIKRLKNENDLYLYIIELLNNIRILKLNNPSSSINLLEVINNCISINTYKLFDKEIFYEIKNYTQDLEVQGNSILVTIILSNIISHLIDKMPKKSKIVFELEEDLTDERILITIRENGYNVSKILDEDLDSEVLSNIFLLSWKSIDKLINFVAGTLTREFSFNSNNITKISLPKYFAMIDSEEKDLHSKIINFSNIKHKL